MSDSKRPSKESPEALLDELESIKALLDAELKSAAPNIPVLSDVVDDTAAVAPLTGSTGSSLLDLDSIFDDIDTLTDTEATLNLNHLDDLHIEFPSFTLDVEFGAGAIPPPAPPAPAAAAPAAQLDLAARAPTPATPAPIAAAPTAAPPSAPAKAVGAPPSPRPKPQSVDDLLGSIGAPRQRDQALESSRDNKAPEPVLSKAPKKAPEIMPASASEKIPESAAIKAFKPRAPEPEASVPTPTSAPQELELDLDGDDDEWLTRGTASAVDSSSSSAEARVEEPSLNAPVTATKAGGATPKSVRPDYSKELLIQEVVDELIPELEATLKARLRALDAATLRRWLED